MAYRDGEVRVGATSARGGAKRERFRDAVNRLLNRIPVPICRVRCYAGEDPLSELSERVLEHHKSVAEVGAVS